MSNLVRMRVIGSAMVVISYFVVLYVSAPIGALGHFIADAISVPYFLKTKAYDVVIMLSFLLIISLSKLAVL